MRRASQAHMITRQLPPLFVLAIAVVLICLTTAMTVVDTATAADDPLRAPATTTSQDGRTVTGAGRTLTVTQAQDLNAQQRITVTGSGYDTSKGIYVALCVIPPTNRPPEPCAGGQDRTGTGGVSGWISSNPPDYGVGLARPYGPGGSFSVTLVANPNISTSLDCFAVRCAVITRNDHLRASDRSQDLMVPITFTTPGTAPPATSAPTPTSPSATQPPTTTQPRPIDPTTLAPKATVSPDGKSVTDGERTLRTSSTTSLDPSTASLAISGSGFDPNVGFYVALCAMPSGNDTPGPCTVPPKAAQWFTPKPPDYARTTTRKVSTAGTFSTRLRVAAHIDRTTDCRTTRCAITIRRDDTASNDRSYDLFLPVTFAASTITTSTSPATTVQGPTKQSVKPPAASRSSRGWVVAVIVMIGALSAGGVVAVRRRKNGAA